MQKKMKEKQQIKNQGIIPGAQKGQVAFEFLLIYSFFIFVFLSSIYIISDQALQQQRYAEGIYAREFIITIAEEINSAALINGYEKKISIPTTINGVPYQIYIYKGMAGLNYSGATQIDILYPLSTNNLSVNGDDTSQNIGYIDVSKGSFEITNVDGTVIITS